MLSAVGARHSHVTFRPALGSPIAGYPWTFDRHANVIGRSRASTPAINLMHDKTMALASWYPRKRVVDSSVVPVTTLPKLLINKAEVY